MYHALRYRIVTYRIVTYPVTFHRTMSKRIVPYDTVPHLATQACRSTKQVKASGIYNLNTHMVRDGKRHKRDTLFSQLDSNRSVGIFYSNLPIHMKRCGVGTYSLA